MKELKFIHITKTAGTSIEIEGRKQNINWGLNHKEYGFHHEYFPRKSQSLKEKYDWFTVIRNPYERVISEYFWLMKAMGVKDKKTVEHFNAFIQKWINNIKQNKVNHPAFGRLNGDHFSPQYLYIDDSVKIHILKFENIKQEFDALMKEYGLNIKLNTHFHVENNKIFTIKDFSRETLDLINDFYAKDFEIFGYTKLTELPA